GPGPGILGSATALGHGGIQALDTAHAALALGARVVLVPRMSSGDPRPRHRGLSHHSETVLRLLLRPVLVALPEAAPAELPGAHEPRLGAADLDGYRGAGLPLRTMGRGPEEDESPLDTAKRELGEEIGKGARTWRHLTTCYSSPGFSDEEIHVYLATDLYEVDAEPGESERIELRTVALAELDSVIAECRDA